MDALNDEFISKDVEQCGDNNNTRMDAVLSFLAGTKHADGQRMVSKTFPKSCYHIQMLRKSIYVVWLERTKLTFGLL